MSIVGQVGAGKANKPDDVTVVQTLLNRHAAWLAPSSPPAVTGVFDAATDAAIKKFQKDAGAVLEPDGVVDPGGFTIRWLDKANIPKPTHAIFADGVLAHVMGPPSADDYQRAATALGCEVAAIQAVSQVETGRGCWDNTGRPKILFERHLFSKWTNGEFDISHSDISSPKRGGYGYDSEQHPKLKRAATLNESAALKSASWGAYQILGENFAQAGFGGVEAMVTDEMVSEKRQLEIFVVFVRASPLLTKALKDHDWTTFARHYNGPAYRDYDYDGKMKAAYTALAPPPPPKTPPGVLPRGPNAAPQLAPSTSRR